MLPMKTLYTVIILFFLFITSVEAQEIQANFESSEASGCLPLTVQFSNTSEFSEDDEVSYLWDLGDGTTSTEFEPENIYLQSGTYSVSLVISLGEDKDTVIKNDYIQVFSSPTPDFNMLGNTMGCAPFEVNMEMQEAEEEGIDIVFWQWDFGDGTISTLEFPQHTYQYENQFSVSLYVVDLNGCQGFITKNNLISVHKPEAIFTAQDTSSCTGGLNVTFQNASTGNDVSYLWDFGDGTESSIEKNPTHSYTTQGDFSPELTVYDEFGCQSKVKKHNYINISHLNANFSTVKDTICIGEQAQFTNLSNPNFTYYWDFGDGQTSTETAPNYAYNTPGDFSVKMKITDGYSCSDSAFTAINIEYVEANFSLKDSFFCSLPANVEFINDSDNAISYQWILADTLASVEENPEITFDSNGFFGAKLLVSSKHGCSSQMELDSCIQIQEPFAYFSPNDWVENYNITGCLPLTVDFQNISVYNTTQDSITDFSWDFGDGHTCSQENPQNIYTELGTYPVTMNITTAKGCSSFYVAYAKTGTEQVADFETNLTDTICASQAVSFTNLSSDLALITKCYWKFGDGQTSFKQDIEHTYIDTGSMDVELLVFNNGCPTKKIVRNMFYVSGPVIIPDVSYNCSDNLEVSLTANSVDADEYFWDFGDGNSSVLEDLTYKFSAHGNHIIELTAHNHSTGCSSTQPIEVFLRNPTAKFNLSQTIGCSNLEVKIKADESEDVTFFDNDLVTGMYLWDFGDGNQQLLSADSVSHVFRGRGTYDVKLIVAGAHGCKDSISKQIKIYEPEVLFGAGNFEGCMPLKADFINNTISDTLIQSYFWDFGDGMNSTEMNPNHTYLQHNNYDVVLTVTDTLGCSSTSKMKDFIKAVKPNPNFNASDRSVCLNDTTGFFATHSSNIATYEWDFGNGVTSISATPKICYKNTGTYNVALSITDNHGCDTSTIFSNFIDVQKYPEPNFKADKVFSNCYPFVVSYENITQDSNIVDWYWDFGNQNGTSLQEEPIYSYSEPGFYSVTLEAISNYGCKTTLKKEHYIEVGGPIAKIVATDTICKDAQTRISFAEANNVSSFKWFTGDGATSIEDTLLYSYKTAGIKRPILLLTSDDLHTCDKFIIDTVFVHDVKVSLVEDDSEIDGCVPFNASYKAASDSAVQWSWSANGMRFSEDQNPQYLYGNSGIYEVLLTGTSSFGCSDTAILTTTVYPPPKIKISNDTAICAESTLNLFAEGGVQFNWQPNLFLDNNEIDNPESTPEGDITYTAEVVDINNCTSQADVRISILPIPIINIADTTVVIGEELHFNLDTAEIFDPVWEPDYQISCTNCYNTTFKPLESTTYTLTYTDLNKCFILTKDINIEIRKEYSIDVPTAFTPNGDGINDIIYVRGWGVEQLISFKIFNRFGEMVFETQDYNQGWNGKYKDKVQNTETYTYIAVLQSYNGEQLTKRGTIKLIK